ncbi:hypothetical protein ACT8ZV_16175 [Nocardioides sp. MAHUQ-72]|uniref:hypothetical protein n=1 Tax=unclassified Nocardioides TaxID=2615069 RepID=UPI00361AF184
MNRYSLASDSRSWWLPAGAAGLASAGVLAACLALVPTGGANADLRAPQEDVQRGYAHIPAETCPPPPDPAYVAGPWVAPDSRCDSLRHWWRYVR